MKIHPRYWLVKKAENELSSKMSEFMNRTDGNEAESLTVNEWIQVLNNVFHGQIGSIIKYEIRNERHGNENKPGDVAGDEEERT